MARSITDINNALIAQVQADPTLGPLLTSTSKVSIWGLLCYVVAVCQWTIENLQDIFKSDVNNTIATLKPHRNSWYGAKALAFQYGYDLPSDSDTYDNTGLTDADIAASQIISYVSVKEQQTLTGLVLRIKVATTVAGDLAALSAPQLTAFTAYMNLIKDAGVKLLITSGAADGLKLTMDIYYNALVLNDNGNRLDGTNDTPVQSCIETYLKNLPFNGVFALENLQNQLESVDGVELIDITNSQSQYGILPYTSFAVYYVPDSGYLRFIVPATDLIINFIPYSE